MFSFIKNTLTKIYTSITSRLGALFGSRQVNAQTLQELEIILLSADTGAHTTRTIIEQLKADFSAGKISQGDDLKKALAHLLKTMLHKPQPYIPGKKIILMVGINGSGKTTCAAKLAHIYTQQGKRVLLVAADTFRAAAREQLHTWAQKINAGIVLGTPEQDPASVVFKGCEEFKKGKYDILIIDTAGRLQTKINLMKELTKIKCVVTKHFPEESIDTLLTIDSMLGQNSFEQAKLFKESTQVNGIILTKMDGTGKGGIVFGIADQLEIPIAYITFGEQSNQIKPFDKDEYIDSLLTT